MMNGTVNEAVYAAVGIPFAAALLLALIPSYKITAAGNVFASGLTFTASLSFLTMPPVAEDYVILDNLNVCFIILNTLVGFSTSAFSASYIGHEIETGRLTPLFVRFYHAMFQGMMGSMNLALLANNIGVMWVGLELATLMTVIMVGIYRTPSALEAAWKYFILGIVGISLAFFGTILVYLAGQSVLGEGLPAMTWSELLSAAPRLDAALLNLAFIFLLVGYGTKAGLAPLHAWLPDAHAEGPTPISAVLSGLLLNVALFALLRFKMLIAAHPGTLKPGPIMIAIGLVSLIFAAFMLYNRRDIKRLFAYSSIEHMGLITFAFGMGGPLANFAGLLHMVMHSLTKSAIFFAVGHVAQAKGTQRLSEIRGLSVSHPALAAGLAFGVIAISGLPPFGAFMSEFLILTSTFAREPLLALGAAFGLIVAFGALLLRLQNVLFGAPSTPDNKVKASSVPLIVHLSLVLVAGLYLPAALITWFQRAAELLG
jgi:hydrogenase-4 component F